ncbi:11-beta-hydroxysteroid dehydrogenase 1A-like [Malania oleifera]|uniref:11-beta-hydroxysteroid dehydrogenase 1A-like n=1 Tax=Malania oleifera TaxID=397392 RepID=UPI0025AE7755|nr:11-beta-hydroxysteroid dehydrogenase 1A-like [Malania oleifera]
MDLVGSFLMSAMTLLVALLCVFLVLPPLLLYKFLASVFRHFSSENMNGKVVLITGASSGIGEQMAYEYAKKGASLVVVARRRNLLQQVAAKAQELGSPDVLVACADVSNADDCKEFVAKAIHHFGRLDHLVNNAGITSICKIRDVTDATNFTPMMDINFWGSVYPTYFAIPHLKKSKGKVVINSSVTAFLNPPRMSFYCASKAALMSFYEALRNELGPTVTITIATLGFVESEMTQGKHLSKHGVIEVNAKLREVIRGSFPIMSTGVCAKAIVEGACRGEKNVTEPAWCKVLFLLKVLCPELIEWYYRKSYFTKSISTYGSSTSTSWLAI